jgi:glycosyltransferase involved in cell wall biosynthesis
MEQKQYKLSVVTPFHNVDMTMFRAAAASLRHQTIGFENIQWIIVLHNCTDDYLPQLQEMFAGDENVVLSVLKNDQRTPSSPRNEGTRLATAKYIAYLDGDDSYTPNCFEVCLREAEETKSQVVWFRREQEKERPDLAFPVAYTKWNQLNKRVVIDRDNWEDDKMFCGLYGMATSYMFDLDFLRRNNLYFHEDILFGEDFMFMIEVCAVSDRICYLPQHIGYHYYVNSHSLVQNTKKTAKELIQYAQGFKRIFDTMSKYGIDSNETRQSMIVPQGRFILGSPELTVEDRKTIKDLLYKYVVTMRLLPADKSSDIWRRTMSLAIAFDTILNPEDPGALFKQITTNGVKTLRMIMHNNANTDYGRKYVFERLDGIMAFRHRVPLSDAETYEPLLKLQMNVGEKNIMTSEPTWVYWQDDAGTLFPCTASHLDSYSEHIAETLKTGKTFFIARSKPVIRTTIDNATVDTMESSLVKEYFRKRYVVNGIVQANLTSEFKSYFRQDTGEEDYADLLLDALQERDIQTIVAFSTQQIATALETLEKKWPSLTQQIADKQRREEVAGILSAGLGPSVLRQLWPQLNQILAFGKGEMYGYTEKVKKYAEGIVMNDSYYYTEEAILGKAIDSDEGLFECLVENCFYELLPLEHYANIRGREGMEVKTRLWTEAETGKPYYLVVTTNAGLYRYITNHIIVPQEVLHHSIKFTIY